MPKTETNGKITRPNLNTWKPGQELIHWQDEDGISYGRAPSGCDYRISGADFNLMHINRFGTMEGQSQHRSLVEAKMKAVEIELGQLGKKAPKNFAQLQLPASSLEDQLAAQLPGFVSKGQAAQKAVDAAVAAAAVTSAPFPASKGSELLDLELLEEHPANPRKLFRKLEELAQQIEATGGLLIPIIARPHPTKPNTYQIVAGARRYRALQALKKKKSPIAERVLVDIRQLTDAQVAEAFLTENDREDLQPLEEADGYQGMLSSGHTPQSIASTLGVGIGTVHARLKLLELSPKARGLLEAGSITSAVATPLARLPRELQDEALERMLDDRNRQGMGGANLWHRGEWENRHDSKEPKRVHVRTAIEWLQENFTKSLKTTAFDQEDTTYEVGDVTPVLGQRGIAPACSACPKNSNNMHPDVAGENPHGRSSSGFCTLPPCYDEKWKLALAKLRADAREQGDVKVLNEAQSRKALQRKDNWGNELRETRFAKLSEVNHDDPKKRTYGQLLELANAELDDGEKVRKVLAVADTGKAQLVDKEELEKVLAATPATKAWAKPKKESSGGGYDHAAAYARRQQESEREDTIAGEVLEKLARQLRDAEAIGAVDLRTLVEALDNYESRETELRVFEVKGERELQSFIDKKADMHDLLALLTLRVLAIDRDYDRIVEIAKRVKFDVKAREAELKKAQKGGEEK